MVALPDGHARCGIDLALQSAVVGIAPALRGWLCGVKSKRVFGEVHAIGRNQAVAASAGAQCRCHLRDGMQRVIVARAAEEGEAAGDSHTAMIQWLQADFIAGDQHRTGKAAVNIEMGDFIE